MWSLEAPAHHDRLLELETSPLGPLCELIALASTWGEVEHGLDEPVLGPDTWVAFAEGHEWCDASQVFDLMVGLWSMSRGQQATRPQPAVPFARAVTSIESARRLRGAEQSA